MILLKPAGVLSVALLCALLIASAAPSEVDITGAYKQSGSIRISASGVGNFTTGTLINSLAICLADGTNCAGFSNSVGNKSGWLNSTNQVWLANNQTNLSIGYLASRPVFFADTTSGRAGVNTSTPSRVLDVVGDVNMTGDLYVAGSLFYNSTLAGTRNTGNISGEGTINAIPLWATSYSFTDSILAQSGSLILVTGSVNVTAMVKANDALTFENPSSSNSTREVWFDSNGRKAVERYWNGSALVINVTG